MPGAGGRADERERRQRQADARRRRALADDDVELEVLHRRVEDLLDGPRQAVDLVDEQDVALLELGEDRGQVAGPLERRARRDVQRHAHLGGGDAGQRGLAEPGRAGEQQVVDGLAAPPGRLDDDAAGAPSARAGRRTRRAAAAAARPRRRPRRRRRRPGRGTRHARRAPSSLSASRSSVARVGVGRQLAQRLADLLGAVAEPGQRLAHVADRRAAAGPARPGRARAPTAGSSARRAAARPSSCRRPARASGRRRRRRRRCRRARPAGGWRGSPSPAPGRRRGWR